MSGTGESTCNWIYSIRHFSFYDLINSIRSVFLLNWLIGWFKVITMKCNNGTCSHPDIFVNLCSLKGTTRNQGSSFQAVLLSTSVIISCLSPVAVAGNALVLAAIWRNASLRTPSYIIVCGLAFTDLCTGLLTEPFYIASRLICWLEPNENKQSFLIYAQAITTSIAAGCGIYCTSLTLIFMTLMSTERWLHMSRRSLLTVRRSFRLVAVVTFILIPIAVFYLQGYFRTCSAIFLAILVLSLTTTSISYFKVFRIVRHHQQQVEANESPQNFGQPAIDLAKYKKSVVTILYILGVSYVSYLPSLVISGLYIAFDSFTNESKIVFMLSLMFLYLSSSLNPVIYIWRMTDLRNGVKTLLMKLFCMQ